MNGTPQQQSNSKASTVEAAIDYIKNLQKEVNEYKEKIAVYEKGTTPIVDGEMKVDGSETNKTKKKRTA